MNIDNLRLLISAAQHGSFAQAARVHDLDPSSVSRIVAQTEKALGIRVFQRTTRRLSPTEAGETFIRRLEALIDEFDRAREEAAGRAGEPEGTIRVTCSVAFGQLCMVPLLPRFRDAFPALALDLMMTDANADLIRDRIDLAIRLAPSIEGDLICSRLRTTRYRVCASPAYLDRARSLAKPEDLTHHETLRLSLPEYRSRWLFRGPDGQIGEVPVSGKIMMSSVLALRDAAIAGLGPALLTDWLTEGDLAAGRLIDLFPSFAVTATTFDTAAWLVYPSRSFLPRKVRATIDFLRAELGK